MVFFVRRQRFNYPEAREAVIAARRDLDAASASPPIALL
jgi:hypothetical protein